MFHLRDLRSLYRVALAVTFAALPALLHAADKAAAPASKKRASTAEANEPAQDTKHNLRYKLKRGDVLRYDVTHRASIRSTIDETTQSAQTRTDSIKVWKVTDVLPNKEIEFLSLVERVHMVNQLPDRESAEYDSDLDKTPPAGFEDAARAVGVPLSEVRITPHGKVTRREAKLRGQKLESDAPVALRLPDEPIEIGGTWDETFDVNVTVEGGGNKLIQTRRHHKLTGVANGIATIQVTYQVLSPIDAPIECQVVQKLMEGEVRFDIEKGRIAGQRMDIDKRILGFAGPTSSMQYIMRMEEKLLPAEAKVASKPAKRTSNRQRPANRGTTTRTSNHPQPQQPSRNNRQR
jgi:hypothetical protein